MCGAACQYHTVPENTGIFFFFNCFSLTVPLLSSDMPMYQVKPICGGHIKTDLPTCMYKLPNIHAQQGNSCTSEPAFQVTVNRFHLDNGTFFFSNWFGCIWLTFFPLFVLFVTYRYFRSSHGVLALAVSSRASLLT